MFKSCHQPGPGFVRRLHPWKRSQACAEASSDLTSKLEVLCPSISKALWSGVGQCNSEIFLISLHKIWLKALKVSLVIMLGSDGHVPLWRKLGLNERFRDGAWRLTAQSLSTLSASLESLQNQSTQSSNSATRYGPPGGAPCSHCFGVQFWPRGAILAQI